MAKDLNLILRTQILEIALNVEQNVNIVLLSHLSIENKERKAITNKSGNLSFKNKIDLLFDLEIFNREEHKYFLLLMEYRNQFLHNIECNSFMQAASFLGPDKEKSLLKFDNSKNEVFKEIRLENAFKILYSKTLAVTLEKIRARTQIIEDKRVLLANMTQNSIYVIDFFFDLIDKLLEINEPNFSDNSEVTKLKIQTYNIVTNSIQNLDKTDEYKLLLKGITLTEEKLKKFFK